MALEVNGLPDRLDLSGAHVAEAMAAGVSIVCSTDAHSVRAASRTMRALGRDRTPRRRTARPGANTQAARGRCP